jgi:hypothetical protein
MPRLRYSKQHLLLAACVGAALSYGVFSFRLYSEVQPVVLAQNNQPLPTEQFRSSVTPASGAIPAVDIDQTLKDLRTQFIGDARSLAEKLRAYHAENPGPQSLAMVCKVIVDMAENSDLLPATDVYLLYQQHRDPNLQRVLAQVLSLRGDNRLLDQLVAQWQESLRQEAPAEQQKILIELAKTHYTGAAEVIVPLLQTQQTAVLLDALLAVRATGNESHIPHLEHLLQHSDQSVSWLANDAINSLQYLSSRARTKLTLADIIAELPPITAP